MRARNPLYVMAKPPPEVQAQIVALPRNDPGRCPDLLHVTLISLYDLHYAPPEWLPATIAALDGFAAAPFALRFDRIENRKAVTLRTRDPLAEARAFQKALVNHLLREKAPIMDGTTPEPHIPQKRQAPTIAATGWGLRLWARRRRRSAGRSTRSS